jgi:chromosomal replication initiator protein
MEKEELWKAALAEIELSISKANFLTWFKNTSVVSRKDGVVLVAVPNAFTKEWLENKYNRLVLRALRNILNDIKEVKFAIRSQATEAIERRAKRRELEVAALESQLNFAEVDSDRESNLNPRYTFESFVVGSSNELAHAAAFSVSSSPGSVYNPLFIYGGVGLGKTHLIQAIGNAVLAQGPKKKVKYVTSDRFTGEMVSAIKNRGMEKLKESYRWIDVLIIDDIQFLAGKEKTQEEFFHTFNALYEKNKQIILSSDRPPRAIPTLEERLRSRFEGGMIADITPPDYETRLAILKAKAAERQYEVEEEVLSFIANSITANIRELEGALNRIIATTQLSGALPSLEKVRALLTSAPGPAKHKVSPKNIIKTVSEFYDVKEEELINQSRKREIVKPRQVCMYLIREELKNSYPFIGERFGGRDHTTVMHACTKIGRELETNEGLVEEINLIRSRLYS